MFVQSAAGTFVKSIMILWQGFALFAGKVREYKKSGGVCYGRFCEVVEWQAA